MTQKTLEQHVRDLLATGYDPVKVEVHARAINEANIEVSMAGQKYSIKGNNVTHILSKSDVPAKTEETPAEAASNAGVPTAEEGNTNSPKSEPAATEPVVGTEGGSEGQAADIDGRNGSAEQAGAGEDPARDAGAGQAGDSAGDGEEALKESTAG